MDIDTPDLGPLIKAARVRQHVTQDELARRLGVSLRTVGAWERGEATPQSLAALEDILGSLQALSAPKPDDGRETLAALIRRRMNELGLSSLREVAEASSGTISHHTVGQLLKAARRTPSEQTIRGLARALDLPASEVSAAAGLPPGDLGPYQPPARFAQLNSRQRRLLDEMGHALLDAAKRGHDD